MVWISAETRRARESKTVMDSRFHTVASGLQVMDSEFFVSRTWILDSNRLWDSGFLKLYSGFQSPGFRILQLKKLLDYGIRTPLHGAKHDSFLFWHITLKPRYSTYLWICYPCNNDSFIQGDKRSKQICSIRAY